MDVPAWSLVCLPFGNGVKSFIYVLVIYRFFIAQPVTSALRVNPNEIGRGQIEDIFIRKCGASGLR